MEPLLSTELDNLDVFVKLTEESRRERQRRLDAGDETARLKLAFPEPRPAFPQVAWRITQATRPQLLLQSNWTVW